MLGRRGSDRPQYLRFESDQTGPIRLGAQVKDADITVPHTRVEIGPGAEALLVAPINVQCQTLALTTNKLIVETTQNRDDAAVFLEAERYEGLMMSVPVVRGGVALSASWPGVHSHPWTSFATDPPPVSDPRIDEALRQLRKFVIAFRSHSKGNLARYRAKLDHARMTKGSGQAVLDLLLSEQDSVDCRKHVRPGSRPAGGASRYELYRLHGAPFQSQHCRICGTGPTLTPFRRNWELLAALNGCGVPSP